jgi:hypothetical protein
MKHEPNPCSDAIAGAGAHSEWCGCDTATQMGMALGSAPMEEAKTMSTSLTTARRRPTRLPFIRFVTYGLSATQVIEPTQHRSQAAAINVSDSGLCLLVNESIQEADIIRVDLPLADVATTSPTLAEVKWVKQVPWSRQEAPQYFVGMQFLL